ncbi:hypothetical protein T4E_1026 [Trichinella pseudospiralis]|uniref:Uncharacterized protein n=1 Tax=Trichinella pseudospiralis TaxID=6337 RepID=A0A0V0XLS9_TRIPS|nr:hypothetical protein T4E_1742 [Trichinella pseudospiralis]KRX88896.1 hypothetical protein T4E_1026 [Trichinella pseudospiralis]
MIYFGKKYSNSAADENSASVSNADWLSAKLCASKSTSVGVEFVKVFAVIDSPSDETDKSVSADAVDDEDPDVEIENL